MPQPYQVVAGWLERVGPAHVQGAGTEWLQHADVVETFCLQKGKKRASASTGRRPHALGTSAAPAPSQARSALPGQQGQGTDPAPPDKPNSAAGLGACVPAASPGQPSGAVTFHLHHQFTLGEDALASDPPGHPLPDRCTDSLQHPGPASRGQSCRGAGARYPACPPCPRGPPHPGPAQFTGLETALLWSPGTGQAREGPEAVPAGENQMPSENTLF